ncbi:MAG: protein-glutamate O-methyltransferase CheR [Desulfobacteraceae bacterium]|nr:protein-glutamate O-methyltransferase CheR [Desulfobacteraceae bacterium]
MTFTLDSELIMSDEEFCLLRDSVYSHCGIYFDNESKYILEKRLAKRLTALNLTSFRDYYHYLKYNRKKDQELMDIMDILTTNETYFFREAYQLKAFTDEVIPELLKRKALSGNRSLRIWSAGCSTGEEAYTIAMLLHGKAELQGWKIEIVGTDISQRVLQHARRAVYGKSSFRATDEKDVKQFFVEQEDGLKVCNEIRDLVSISHLNLFDVNRMIMLGKMDLIFCRNVIIYFDLAAKKRVVESFFNTLYEGGYLLLGHSESLMNVTTQFTLRHFKNDMIYQKPEATVGVRP